MKSKRWLIPAPVYIFISLAGILIFGYFYPTLKLIPYPYTLIGILFFIIGFLFAGSAGKLFMEDKTTINPNKKSSKLIVRGPYRFSRNPIYFGISLILLGLAIFSGSLISILFAFLFPALVNFIIIPFEEKVLAKTFGNQYSKYKLKVRRWI